MVASELRILLSPDDAGIAKLGSKGNQVKSQVLALLRSLGKDDAAPGSGAQNLGGGGNAVTDLLFGGDRDSAMPPSVPQASAGASLESEFLNVFDDNNRSAVSSTTSR